MGANLITNTLLTFAGGAPFESMGVGAGSLGYARNVKVGAELGRVFWSGGKEAMKAAANYAKANGVKTLEMTTRGRIMAFLNPITPQFISKPIWRSMSRGFANRTTSKAHFFTTPLGPRQNSIWMTVEKPILELHNIPIIIH